jgi:hypothetical protein
MDYWAGKTIRANQRKKAKAAKKQGQTNANLGRQWETSLSRQYDNDGNYTEYGPVAIDNSTKQKKIVKVINLRGQEVSYDQFTATGIYIEVYDDGTMRRIWK